MSYIIKQEHLDALTPADKEVITAIYHHRCLNEPLLYKHFYSKEKVKRSHAEERIKALTEAGYLSPVDYGQEYPVHTEKDLVGTGVSIAYAAALREDAVGSVAESGSFVPILCIGCDPVQNGFCSLSLCHGVSQRTGCPQPCIDFSRHRIGIYPLLGGHSFVHGGETDENIECPITKGPEGVAVCCYVVEVLRAGVAIFVACCIDKHTDDISKFLSDGCIVVQSDHITVVLHSVIPHQVE